MKRLTENRKYKNIFHSKIKSLWFKSYLLIVALLIVAGIFSLGIAKHILSNENKVYCNAIIESEKNRTDEKLLIAVNMARKIADDNSVLDFAQKPYTDSTAYEAYYLSKNINSYCVFEEAASEVYIAFNKSNYVVGNTFTGEKSSFERTMQFKYDEELIKVINSDNGGVRLFKGGMAYKMPVVVNSTEVAQIYIFFNTTYMLNNDNKDLINIYVANNEGYITCLRRSQYMNNAEHIEKVRAGYNSKDFLYVGDSVILAADSDIGDMYYIFEMPKNRYKQGENVITAIMFGFLVLCVIGGIYLSVKMIDWNYFPIQQILDKLKYGKDEASSHEYEIINKAIDELVSQNNLMSDNDKKKTTDLRNIYFTHLFNCRNITNKEILDRNQLKRLGMNFPNDGFVVCMCYIDDISYYFENKSDPNKDYALCRYIVLNVARDVFSGIDKWMSCEVDGLVTFIFDAKDGKISDYLVDKIITLSTLLNECVDIKVFIGVSSVHSGLKNLSLAYDEIKNCRAKQAEYNENTLFYNEIVEYQRQQERGKYKAFYYFPQEKEKSIIDCIKSGKEDELLKILEEIITVNKQNNAYSVYKMKYLGYDLICTVAKLLDRDYNDALEKKLGIKDVFWEIEQCRDFEGVKDVIMNVMSCICNENGQVTAENRSTRICRQVKEYIEQNYSDPNLSLVSIATKFNLNDTYLSSTYKKTYSIGMTEYLKIVRITRSKELLRENKYTIEQISEMVGYSNSRTFTRSFKAITGVTPKVFAENQK